VNAPETSCSLSPTWPARLRGHHLGPWHNARTVRPFRPLRQWYATRPCTAQSARREGRPKPPSEPVTSVEDADSAARRKRLLRWATPGRSAWRKCRALYRRPHNLIVWPRTCHQPGATHTTRLRAPILVPESVRALPVLEVADRSATLNSRIRHPRRSIPERTPPTHLPVAQLEGAPMTGGRWQAEDVGCCTFNRPPLLADLVGPTHRASRTWPVTSLFQSDE